MEETNLKFRIIEKKIVFYVVVFSVVMLVTPVKAQSYFTEEEQEYINGKGVIKAVSIDGVV